MKIVKKAVNTARVLAMGCGSSNHHPNCQGKHSN